MNYRGMHLTNQNQGLHGFKVQLVLLLSPDKFLAFKA